MVNLEEFKNRFSESGQRVLELAYDKARQRGQNHITIDHILNALAFEETFLFDMAMRNLSLDPSLVRATLKRRLDASPKHVGEGVKVGQDAIELFKDSMARAKSQGRDTIEVSDLFITIAQQENLFPELTAVDSTEEQAKNEEVPFYLSEPDFQKRAWLRVLILVVVLLGVIDISTYLLRKKFQAINESIKYPSYSQITTIKMPDFDPVLGEVHRQGQYHDFIYAGEYSSDAVLAVRKKQFRAKDLLAANEYRSLYCFLDKLNMEGRPEDEFETLKAWVERTQNEPAFSWWQQRYLLSYLGERYTDPIELTLKNSQYGRARSLAIEAAKRARIVDTRASLDPSVREGINKILLTEALLWQPKLSFGHPREIGTLYNIVNSDFDESHLGELMNLGSSPELSHLRSYWLGVYEFRKQNLPSALAHFKDASTAHDNPKLKSLALLMQARCLFWTQRNLVRTSNESGEAGAERIDGAAVIRDLEGLIPSVEEPSYAKTIQYYVDELRRL